MYLQYDYLDVEKSCHCFSVTINTQLIKSRVIILPSLGGVEDLSFFEYLSAIYFLLIEFHCAFFIS